MNAAEIEALAGMKTPERRAEFARIQAKTAVHQDALVAEAIRDAVRQERADVDEFLAARTKGCPCSMDGYPTCWKCTEMALLRTALKGRPER